MTTGVSIIRLEQPFDCVLEALKTALVAPTEVANWLEITLHPSLSRMLDHFFSPSQTANFDCTVLRNPLLNDTVLHFSGLKGPVEPESQ